MSTEAAATCAYQLNDEINGRNETSVGLNTAGAVSASLLWGTQIAQDESQGLLFEGIGAANDTAGGGLIEAGVAILLDVPVVGSADGAAPGLDVAGGALIGAGVQFGTLGGDSLASGVAKGLEVTGLVAQAADAGVQIATQVMETYASNLPFCDSEFTGTITADANINANQGISAMNGAIWLGNPDGQTYQQGIALGGGALSGAGTGDLATSDDADAIAIGNGAHAGNGNVAIGTLAMATAADTTAIGSHAVADQASATALGSQAIASGSGSTALGAGARAFNPGGIAGGTNMTAVGQGAIASNDNATATGQGAQANGMDSSSYGQGAIASADQSTAVGAGAQAPYKNSAAYGANAAATAENQQVFGTTSNRYTLPGLASAESTAAQQGPLSLVTSDADGNLAADRELYRQIGQNRQGVAMAMALGNFYVPQGKRFAMGMNTATFDGTWAFGLNMGGQVSDGVQLNGGAVVSQTGIVSARVGGIVAW